MQTFIKRLDETAPYGYNFQNDPVISGGDPIASVVGVVVTALTPGATLPTLGTPSFSGMVASVNVSGGQDGSIYQFEWKVRTVGGFIRVGLGKLFVQDSS